jgi:hypothetical protein
MFGLLDAASGVDIVGRAVIENKLELDLAVHFVVDNNDNDEIDIDCLTSIFVVVAVEDTFADLVN